MPHDLDDSFSCSILSTSGLVGMPSRQRSGVAETVVAAATAGEAIHAMFARHKHGAETRSAHTAIPYDFEGILERLLKQGGDPSSHYVPRDCNGSLILPIIAGTMIPSLYRRLPSDISPPNAVIKNTRTSKKKPMTRPCSITCVSQRNVFLAADGRHASVVSTSA